MRVGSDTFGDPIFQKGLTKLAIILDYKRPWMLCLALPSFAAWSKIEVTKIEFALNWRQQERQENLLKVKRIFHPTVLLQLLL